MHVVEQIERVADAGKPDRADQRVARRQRAGGLRSGEGEDEEGTDGQRRHQLRHRRELQAIVVHPDHRHRKRRKEHGRPRAGHRSALGNERDHAEADNRGQRDRDATHGRSRRRAPAIGTRRHDSPDRRRTATYDGTEPKSDGRGDYKRERFNHCATGTSELRMSNCFSFNTNVPFPRIPSQIVSSPCDRPGNKC